MQRVILSLSLVAVGRLSSLRSRKGMYSKGGIKWLDEVLCRAFCPDPVCRQSLVFTPMAKFVQCPACNNTMPSNQAMNVTTAESIEQVFIWLQEKVVYLEKSSRFGNGRARLVSRTIDGVSDDKHCETLEEWFEGYGVFKGDKVKKLSEMGRSEPINLTTLGEVTFGIRKEHLDVTGYGRDLVATRYMWSTINAIGKMNGKDDDDGTILVALTSKGTEWVLNSSRLVSRACTGREVFGKRLRDETIAHLKKYADDYKRRFNDRTVNLAAMANVICRSIVLLDSQPPYVVEIFVPFLWQPDETCDSRGKKRTPIVLAWSDRSRTSLVLMASMADHRQIKPVRLPRSWFRSVWGFDNAAANNMISQYFDFDDEYMCLVANGMYFKPEYLRRYVMAFENAALNRSGVIPWLLSEWVQNSDGPNADADTMLVMASTNEQLWRCLQCQRLAISIEMAKPEMCLNCHSRKYMRQQNVDGAIKYVNGDHTSKPSLVSRCCLKRKHFCNGTEFDNAPMYVEIESKLSRGKIRERILWFCGESDLYRNSNIPQVTTDLIRKFVQDGSLDAIELNTSVASQIVEQTFGESRLVHEMFHLKEVLGDRTENSLFDDYEEPPKSKAVAKVGMSDMDAIFARAEEMYDDYSNTAASLEFAMNRGWNTDNMKSVSTANDLSMREMERDTIARLEMATSDLDAGQRCRLICMKRKQFCQGGFYHTWAIRKGYKKPEHFELPILGNAKFAFSADNRSLVTCLLGEHVAVHERIDDLVSLIGDSKRDEDYECDVED